MTAFNVTPVGVVRSTRSAVVDDGWDAETASIELDAARFGDDALVGLDAFSHVEVVFLMDRAVEPAAGGLRRPRDNPGWPAVGLFAQRRKDRPNRIGTTVCRVLGVEGRVLRVGGLDAIDGTPVLDLKPWMAEFGPRGAVHQPAWATQLMATYWR